MEKRARFSSVFLALLSLPVAAAAQEAPDPFDLPSARNVWAILESQEPGIVTDRVDVGGLRSATAARFGGFGNTWTQNRFTLAGLDITDPYSGGVPLLFPELVFLEGLRVSPADHDSSAAGPGILLSLLPRAGGDRLRGGADLYFTDGSFQDRSLQRPERESGISSPEHFGRFVQASAHAGVPIGGSALFAAVSDDELSRYPEDVAEKVRSERASALLSLAGASRGHAWKVLGALQREREEAAGATALEPPSSSPDATRTSALAVLSDSVTVDPAAVLDLRLGGAGTVLRERSRSGTDAPSALELFRGNRTGAPPILCDGRRARYELAAAARRAVGPALDLEAGASWQEITSSDRSTAPGGVNLQLFAGEPYAVVLYDPPAKSRQRVRNLSAFGQARIRLGDRASLSAGARFDSAEGWLPGGGVGTIRWTTLSPRIAATASAGRPWLFHASYARYAHALLASDLEVFDPRSPSGRVALWTDANGDGRYEPGEEGQVLRVFGGRFASVDPHLRPPVTDEVSAAVEWHSRRPWVVGLTYRQRREKRLLETIDAGVPGSSYTPVPYVDPGNDGIPGTGDDRTIVVYDQDPSTLGRDRFVLTNPAGFRAFYQGLELESVVSSRNGRFRLQGSFTAYRIIGSASQAGESLEYDEGVIGNLYDNPNTGIHADGRLFFDRAYAGKVAALYRLPGDIAAGAVAKYEDGLPFARKILVTGMNQGVFYVFATQRGNRTAGIDPRNGARTEYTLTLDLGVEKGFPLAGGRLALRVDVFNATNAHQKTRENDLTGPDFKARLARETEAPRVFRLGVRIDL